MKKGLLFLLCCLCAPFICLSQSEFPYSKVLRMSPAELKEAKFKYDSERNRYVLKKTHWWNPSNIVTSNLAGPNNEPIENIPHVDDYVVIVQYGDEGAASLSVTFYNDNTYHELMTFAADNGENLLETDSNTKRRLKYNYAGLSFELGMEIKSLSAAISTTTTGTTTNKTSANTTVSQAKSVVLTKDESYNIYTYTILTGLEPNSKWLQKEAEKQQKRDDKGRKKNSAADLM